jgi:2-polyprenyl-3-methyl-5-hydroxy-6-metoxy-1,4-benzoquinol methylase
MYRNLVNRYDVVRLARKLERMEAGRVLTKLRTRGRDRVVAHWSNVDPSTQEWWAIPAVQRRWNTFASGDPDVTFPMHVARTHLAGRTGLRALSLGCGTGGNEVNWARLGVFESIEGVDIAPARITAAAAQADRLGLSDVLHFRVADAHELIRARASYDVVLGLQSLHHFDHLDETMAHVRQLVRPDGLLVVDEFVGPTRFQWTDAQLAAANRLLEQLPEERRRLADGRLKRQVIRPSRLAMILDDPSEAVDASRLMPAVRENFEMVEELPYGGTVLHLALSGIAQHFRDDTDPATWALLEGCFAVEDAVLPEIGHDFVFAVCRRVDAPRADPAALATGSARRSA